MNTTYTENEVREIALRCMGFMQGQLEEYNKSILSNSVWVIEPNHIRNNAIKYMDTLIKDMKQNKNIT